MIFFWTYVPYINKEILNKQNGFGFHTEQIVQRSLFKNHAFRIWYSDQHLQQYILKECCGDLVDQWGIVTDSGTKPVGKQYGPNHPSKPEQGAHQESQVDEKSCSLGRCDGSRQVSFTKKLFRLQTPNCYCQVLKWENIGYNFFKFHNIL